MKPGTNLNPTPVELELERRGAWGNEAVSSGVIACLGVALAWHSAGGLWLLPAYGLPAGFLVWTAVALHRAVFHHRRAVRIFREES